MFKWLGMMMAVMLVVGLSGCAGGDGVQHGATESPAVSSDAPNVVSTKLEAQTLEVACGVCIYGMEGKGCPIAADVNGEKIYISFADGATVGTIGEEICEGKEHAKVTGEVKDGKLVVSSLELLSD